MGTAVSCEHRSFLLTEKEFLDDVDLKTRFISSLCDGAIQRLTSENFPHIQPAQRKETEETICRLFTETFNSCRVTQQDFQDLSLRTTLGLMIATNKGAQERQIIDSESFDIQVIDPSATPISYAFANVWMKRKGVSFINPAKFSFLANKQLSFTTPFIQIKRSCGFLPSHFCSGVLVDPYDLYSVYEGLERQGISESVFFCMRFFFPNNVSDSQFFPYQFFRLVEAMITLKTAIPPHIEASDEEKQLFFARFTCIKSL